MSSDSVMPLSFTSSAMLRNASSILWRQANDVETAMPHSRAALRSGNSLMMQSMYFFHIANGLGLPAVIVLVRAVKDLPQSTHMYFCAPSFLWPLRTTCLLPQCGHTTPSVNLFSLTKDVRDCAYAAESSPNNLESKSSKSRSDKHLIAANIDSTVVFESICLTFLFICCKFSIFSGHTQGF